MRRRFGIHGPEVALIGQGTWNLEAADPAAAIAALRRGLDLGMDHIDTAEMYGSGKAERIVAQAIAGRPRDSVFLVSKVLPSNASRRGTVRACEQSLKRLGVDHLDGYLLHWRGQYPLAETFAAFDELQRAGKIRWFGVSNFDVDDLQEALDLLGPGKLACNQVLYHLEERAIEHAVLPWCERQGVALVAYSPLGNGQFPSSRSAGGRVLEEIAAELGVTPHAVALAFLTVHDSVLAIPKAADPDHVAANAAAGSLILTPAQIDRIDHAFPRGARPRSLPMI